uniref:HSF-type DNA-binding domain-containing protein n=1 Tax=Mycena chlorophos TaxID=658473 RepID=A0ABQ0LDZ5_MYCCL|nr:predicted protein [Mycena chlorophos]
MTLDGVITRRQRQTSMRSHNLNAVDRDFVVALLPFLPALLEVPGPFATSRDSDAQETRSMSLENAVEAKKPRIPLPSKLFRMLSDPANQDIIRFHPYALDSSIPACILILNGKKLVADLLPRSGFTQTTLLSFCEAYRTYGFTHKMLPKQPVRADGFQGATLLKHAIFDTADFEILQLQQLRTNNRNLPVKPEETPKKWTFVQTMPSQFEQHAEVNYS